MLEGITCQRIQCFKLRPGIHPVLEVSLVRGSPSLDGQNQLCSHCQPQPKRVENEVFPPLDSSEKAFQRANRGRRVLQPKTLDQLAQPCGMELLPLDEPCPLPQYHHVAAKREEHLQAKTDRTHQREADHCLYDEEWDRHRRNPSPGKQSGEAADTEHQADCARYRQQDRNAGMHLENRQT